MTEEIVYSVEAADLLTPVGAFMRLSTLIPEQDGKRPYRLLLESVEGGAARGVIPLSP